MTQKSDPKDELVTHLPAMRAFALSLARNGATADDLVQEAILKAWSNFESFEPGSNMRAWLFTILRNSFYSLHRKRRREVEDPDGVMSGALAVKPDHDGRLMMDEFRTAFEQLTDEQREVLILVGAEGFSYEEAAEMCDCAVGTIKSRTNRARKRLAELMHLTDEVALEITDGVTLSIVTDSSAA